MNTSSLESAAVALLLATAVAMIHAMFQLGVSVLTLLSGHSLGARSAHLRLLRLNTAYILGAFVAVFLLAVGITSLVQLIDSTDISLWLVAVGVCLIVGVIISFAYYRRGKGTILWIPRSMAEYLTRRAKRTKLSVEASALGAMTVIAELPFAIAPLLIVALLLQDQTESVQFAWSAAYAAAVVMPLVIITILIGSGHKLSIIQRWREDNKAFLQYSSGLGLLLIAIYIGVFKIFGAAL